MRPFDATYGIKETARNTKEFIADHMEVFWNIFKPLAPYIIGLLLFDAFINALFFTPDPETGKKIEFSLGQLISNYFFACLIISWHRVVLDGPDRFTPMNPFKPQKSEWAFIGMSILVFLIPFFAGVIGGILTAATNGAALAIIILIALILVAILIMLKVVFYFPSKATGNTITLKQSFKMTDGYIIRMFCANILAALKPFLIMMAYLILAGVLVGSLAFAAQNSAFTSFLGFVYAMPIVLYFQPLLTIIGVTVLSNYYQHALQNKGVPA